MPAALTDAQIEHLLAMLKNRFDQHPRRHPELTWADVHNRLEAHPEKLWSLHEMERSGGEPDVVEYDPTTGEYIFCDCATESPAGRRSLCYDQAALDKRKENKPAGSAMGMAAAMGIELLDEETYRQWQKQCGPWDTKTSSWLTTPEEVRRLGGALFGDYRYGRVFIYHNGAESYYAARGFRGMLRV